jgi:hypothetical protein
MTTTAGNLTKNPIPPFENLSLPNVLVRVKQENTVVPKLVRFQFIREKRVVPPDGLDPGEVVCNVGPRTPLRLMQ